MNTAETAGWLVTLTLPRPGDAESAESSFYAAFSNEDDAVQRVRELHGNEHAQIVAVRPVTRDDLDRVQIGDGEVVSCRQLPEGGDSTGR